MFFSYDSLICWHLVVLCSALDVIWEQYPLFGDFLDLFPKKTVDLDTVPGSGALEPG